MTIYISPEAARRLGQQVLGGGWVLAENWGLYMGFDGIYLGIIWDLMGFIWGYHGDKWDPMIHSE
jgi:hypothetical protein